MTTEKKVRGVLHEKWRQLEALVRVLEDPATHNRIVEQGVEVLVEATAKLDELLSSGRPGTWPEPTVSQPDMDTLEAWIWEGICEATDGCATEPDGHCPHGYPSWMLVLGYI